MFNFFKRRKNIKKNENIIEKDPYKRWNPNGKTEKDIEIYNPLLAKEIFPNTSAYKVYENKGKNLQKTLDELIKININLYFHMYYDIVLELSSSKKHSNDLSSYMENFVKDDNEEEFMSPTYKVQLMDYAQSTGDLYYNTINIKMMNDLIGDSFEYLLSYIKKYIKDNASSLFIARGAINTFGRSCIYDEDIENKMIELMIDMTNYCKNDMPYQDGDTEFVKKESVIKMCMKKMNIFEFYEDLKNIMYDFENRYFG